MTNVSEEIKRVELAIEKTDSQFLKRDYGKYLKKLRRKLRTEVSNGKAS